MELKITAGWQIISTIVSATSAICALAYFTVTLSLSPIEVRIQSIENKISSIEEHLTNHVTQTNKDIKDILKLLIEMNRDKKDNK